MLFSSVMGLILFLMGLGLGPTVAQNWDDEKTFWTKNSVKLLNERLDRFEKRLAKAERPRQLIPDGKQDVGTAIRPRRPLTQQQHLHAHIDYLETVHRQPYETRSLFEYAWGGWSDRYDELYALWLAELKETKRGKEEAHQEATQ